MSAGSPMRKFRKEKQMTMKELAEASGVNINQIAKAETGIIDPGNMTAKNLLAIADALGVDPHELLLSHADG